MNSYSKKARMKPIMDPVTEYLSLLAKRASQIDKLEVQNCLVNSQS